MAGVGPDLASAVVAMEKSVPEREIERRIALETYAVLDTHPEPRFDEIAQLAAQVCDTPIALIRFIDRDRQWIKARVGLAITDDAIDVPFCSHAIEQDDILIVPDAARDVRFVPHPLVDGEPNVRFYAGAPLTVGGELKLGTLAVIDHVPRSLRPDQVVALRTLSRHVVAQIELRRHVVELRRAVEERKLAESGLRDFVAMVTHDIRNPLDVIRGYSSMLRDEETRPNALAALDQIDSGTESILALVSNYLESSRLAAGKLDLELVTLPFGDLLRRVTTSYQGAARRREITLELVVDAGLPDIVGESMSLERIVGNLLHNAVKFTPEGGHISVRAERRGEHVVLTVCDNGPGVPVDDLPRLFQSYWQSQANRHMGGTGLGLFIVRVLTEALGGRVTATNVASGGCCFEVTLRAARSCDLGQDPPPPRSLAVAAAEPPRTYSFRRWTKAAVVA